MGGYGRARARSLLRVRLGRDEEGVELHPLPGHGFRAEQDTLACYSFPGWEQRRGLPHFSSFEHPDGRSKSLEEFECATGKSMTDWDIENVAGLVKGTGKLSGKKGSASTAEQEPRGLCLLLPAPRDLRLLHDAARGEPKRRICRALHAAETRGPTRDPCVRQRMCASELLHAAGTGPFCQRSFCRRQVRCYDCAWLSLTALSTVTCNLWL
jgi:hypothetical protein